MLIVVNIDENQLSEDNYPNKAEVEAYCKAQGYELISVCAKTEQEIEQLPPEDKQLFLDELGISEPGIHRIAKAIYAQLGLISFSHGRRRRGLEPGQFFGIFRQKKAAGKIHSDIERGFIRAETVAFADLKNLRFHGSGKGQRVFSA